MTYPIASVINHFFSNPYETARVEVWKTGLGAIMFHDVNVYIEGANLVIESKQGKKVGSYSIGDEIKIDAAGITITKESDVSTTGIFIQLV